MAIETITAKYFPNHPTYSNAMDLVNAKGADGYWIALREGGKKLGEYGFTFQRDESGRAIETTTAQYFDGCAYRSDDALIEAFGQNDWWIAVREPGKTGGAYNFIFQRFAPEV